MKVRMNSQFSRLFALIGLLFAAFVFLSGAQPAFSEDKSFDRLDVNFVEMVSRSEKMIKQNVEKILTLKSGLTIFSYQYKHDPRNTYIGLMADDVAAHKLFKPYVIHMGEGRYAINYEKLGLHPVTLETWEKEGLAALTTASIKARRGGTGNF